MKSRSIVEWTTDDFPSVVALAERMSDYVEANEPETLAFEWFGNENTGKVVWYQVYANDEAFLTHARNMIEAGFRVEAQQLLTQDRLLLLTPLTHPRTREMARQVGAEQVVPIRGVIR
ncbi:MAG TPA: hypothetical protein VF148_02390 [Acidimicrobiia bacterium]